MGNPISPQDQPIQSADKKYYRSGQPSVIQRSIADSTLKHPHQLKPHATPRAVDPKVPTSGDTPRSADVYYANDKRATPPKPFNFGAREPKYGGSTTTAIQHGQSTHPITILTEEQVRPGAFEALYRIRQGVSPVRVAVAQGRQDLLQKVRQAVEFAVTREEITEDQSRDIQYGWAGTPAVQGPKEVKAEEIPATPNLFGDPSQFVAQEEDAEPQEAVATVDEPSPPAPETVEEVDDEDAPADDEDELDRSVDTDRPVKEIDAEEKAEEAKAADEEADEEVDEEDE